jgi:hypothetical protein
MLNRKTEQNNQNEITFTSRIPIPPDSTKRPDNVAICNGTEMSEFTHMNFLQAQSMVFYDTAKQPRYNAIRVWIPKISGDFADASRYHINFYKWKADAQGTVYFEKTKLQLRMEKRADKKNASGYMETLNWGRMKEALAADGVNTSNMATIFNDYSLTILLDQPQISDVPIPYEQDEAVEYDVLKIAVYKDNNLIEQKDFLLPAFYAHPLSFADGKAKILKELHPFNSEINSTWPGSHFAELLNANCF